MRIRIIQTPTLKSVDGIRLDRFERGREYDVGHNLAAFLVAAGWAELVARRPSKAAGPPDAEPPRIERRTSPPNLIRELFPPYLDRLPPDLAAQFDRRRRRRRDV